jgi:enoyl-CoA hydratase/carnithine racemase
VVNVKKLGYISGIKRIGIPAFAAARGADVASPAEETPMATCETLLVDRPRAGVAVATLNRPDRLNALTFGMFDELAQLAADVGADDRVRVLVLTGAGRGFCAGLDLRDAATLPDMPTAKFLEGQERWSRAITAFRRLPKPVIAAVNGPAAGAGFSLALAADIRIAASAARFNAAFIKIGLTGGDCGSSWMLPRIVGLGHANEILLTGRLVEADEAARIGLVNRVVPAGDLLTAALDTAELIAANSPLGVRLTKQMVQVNVDAPSLEAAVELENRNQTLAAGTQDMVEAFTAFREKRPPVFTGL